MKRNFVCIGKSCNGNMSFLHMTYKASNIDGFGVEHFTIFDNQNIDVTNIVPDSSKVYEVDYYVSKKGYPVLNSIRMI